MATKILFAPKQSDAVLEIARSLTPAGFELLIADIGTPEFYAAAAQAEYYLGLARQMGGEFFRSAPNLKLVQLLSAGYDRVDIEAARKAKVPVSNNGGANAIAVAEHTIMLILAVLKRVVRFHNDVVAGKWRVGGFDDQRVYELSRKTLGIVGLGNIGKKVARRAAAFDMAVQYYDIARLTEAEEDALGVRFVLLPELLRTSDVVSLHVPLDDSTRHLIGARELAQMKPDAILINTCRGPVVDEAALHAALESGQIAGAGLDVLVEEPPATNHPLFTLPNVTLTPHSAGPTWENWTARFRNGFDNIQRVAAGRAPKWVIPELRDLQP
ncbi:MAG TPA: 2-hydroxyacid dehydrogenase [Methylomirabilota bacterium]|nr:2-hydroxyacid dehydrogenase [Methylomirabilota bacterium]